MKRVAAVLAVLVCAACSSARAQGRPQRVVDAGDSVALVALSAVTAAYAGDRIVPVVRIATSDPVAPILPRLRNVANGRPAVFIEAFGPDEALDVAPSWRADEDALIGMLVQDRCVVVQTVSAVMDDVFFHPNKHSQPIAVEWNAELGRAVLANRNFHLVDWSAATVRVPALLAADELHPSRAGSVWLAAQYRKAC